jgi:NADH dehydrogenase (ubiquinone) Fe-S protein 1
VNTEGRSQLGRAAVPPPGVAREDWKIIRYVANSRYGIEIFIKAVHSALSEILDNTLPYDDVLALRDRMWELSPSLVRYGTLERTSTDIALAGLKTLAAHTASAKVTGAPFAKPISNFYQTDPISRACVLAIFLLVSESHHGLCDVAGR